MKNDNNFKFYFPADLEKASDSKGQEVMKFKGIASTADQDSQNETLDPRTFDLRKTLWINWNHAGSKDPSTIIGETTKTELTPKNELYIEGYLYPEVEKAKATYNLMKALQNSPNGNKLGISVEGKVVKRGSEDEKNPLYNKILKAKITGAALCPVPINGKTWADICKGEIDNSEEEEYDEETTKAMTAAAGVGVTTQEDVEGEKNKKETPVIVGQALKKSDIYERIHNKFPQIDVEKAKSVYSLIEKIIKMESTEKTITDETISKAFDILNLASEELTKAAKTEKMEDKKAEVEEEDEDEKEMVQKACDKFKMMKGDGKSPEEMKAALLKKGYGEKIVEKAMKLGEEKETEVKKSDVIGLSKEEVSEIIKSELNSVNTKFEAVNTILKSQLEANDDLKKSLDVVMNENTELKEKVETLSKTSVGPKSLITKSYSEKGSFEKSESGESKIKYNLKSKQDRQNLKLAIMDLSGINKGEKFDVGLADIAQELELTQSLHKASDIKRLQALGLELVVE